MIGLIEKFEQFSFGKRTLISLRNKTKSIENLYGPENQLANINDIQIQDVITTNGGVKKEFDIELMKISIEFRNRIRG